MIEVLAVLVASLVVQGNTLTNADVHFLEFASFQDAFLITEAPPSGQARIECVIEATGWLSSCRTREISDDRLAALFAESARGFRVGPETRSGEPTAGRTLEIIVQWGARE